MPASAGLNAGSAAPLTDWDHVVQSIGVILTTPIGSRVMRREFGSEVPALINRPMTPRVMLAVYAACAVALARWEPRFRLTGCEIVEVEATGALAIAISGQYLPRGHRGDATPEGLRPRSATIGLGRLAT